MDKEILFEMNFLSEAYLQQIDLDGRVLTSQRERKNLNYFMHDHRAVDVQRCLRDQQGENKKITVIITEL